MDSDIIGDFLISFYISAGLISIEAVLCHLFRKFVFKRPLSLGAAAAIDVLVFTLVCTPPSFLVADTISFSHGALAIFINIFILNHGYKDYKAEIDKMKEEEYQSNHPDKSKYDFAYLRVQDFCNGLYNDLDSNEYYDMALFTVRCLYFCLGWCIFHSDKSRRDLIDELQMDLLWKANPSELSDVTVHDKSNVLKKMLTTDYASFSNHMLAYKKDIIDPEYLKNSSKENYEKLVYLFVREIISVSDIEYYSGIISDFKSCMNEE